MNVKIRGSLLQAEKLSYAKDGVVISADMLDCSAGYNPYGAPPLAVEALKHLHPALIYQYPHGEALQEALVEYWRPYVALTKSNIMLTDGSIDGIYLVNAAFSAKNAAVLAVSPQFSDYMAHAQFMDIRLSTIKLRPENEFKICVDDMLGKMNTDIALLYLDNPNNPTGQQIPLEEVRLLLQKAKECNICVISDEAYGDYMEESQSAACLLSEFDNLIVLRTFSKGFGLAGMRIGYILSNAEICHTLNKISNPYTATQPSRIAAEQALKDHVFLQNAREQIAITKQKLRAAIGHNLKMSCSFDACPICVLYHAVPTFDLEREFAARGILTYSGTNFDNLGVNAVRLRLPHIKDCEKLLVAAREIDQIS